jgi:hypothetical protein
VRRAIQQRPERIRTLAERYALNPTTGAKWKQRTAVHAAPLGPKPPCSTALTREQEAIGGACPRPTLRPLDDGLSARHSSLPQLTRSAWPRGFQRHRSRRLPEVEGALPAEKKGQTYPLGYVHLARAEGPTAAGRLSLVVASARVSTWACAERPEKATRRMAADCLRARIAAVPDQIHTVLTDHGRPFTGLAHVPRGAEQPQDAQPPEG